MDCGAAAPVRSTLMLPGSSVPADFMVDFTLKRAAPLSSTATSMLRVTFLMSIVLLTADLYALYPGASPIPAYADVISSMLPTTTPTPINDKFLFIYLFLLFV